MNRGGIIGSLWGLSIAPIEIPKEKRATDFTLKYTARTMLNYSITIGSFCTVYTGLYKCNQFFNIFFNY